jgi:hypothetical protein
MAEDHGRSSPGTTGEVRWPLCSRGVVATDTETRVTDLMHSKSHGGSSDSEMQQNQLEVRVLS